MRCENTSSLNSFPATVAHPYADAVVVGITLTCVILFFLVTLTATGYYFIYKSVTVKKDLLCGDLKCARKDALNY